MTNDTAPSSVPALPRRLGWAPWAMLALGVLLGAGGHALWVHRLAAQATLNTALASDVEDWALLARTQASQGRFVEALPAFRKAMALRPNDATLMADTAEVMANANGQKLEGEAADLVGRALALDPKNLKALVLVAGAASARGDHAAAAGLWARALPSVPPGQPELGKYLQTRLDDANQKAGTTVTALVASASASAPASAVVPALLPSAPLGERVATPTVEPAPAPAPVVAAAPLAGITGTVVIAPEALANVAPGDAVIVTVAAADKPDTPLLTQRKLVKELPWRFKFTDDQAKGLVAAKRVVVQAHVAHSGKVVPQAGDWQGQTGPVAVGSTGLKVEVVDAVR